MKKIKSGHNFIWAQEQELLEIIKNGLPAQVCSYVHTHGDSTLEELRRSVKDKQAMGLDEGNVFTMKEQLHTITTESVDSAIAPLSRRLDEVWVKPDAIQQEQKATAEKEG